VYGAVDRHITTFAEANPSGVISSLKQVLMRKSDALTLQQLWMDYSGALSGSYVVSHN
jgi:hypothetical protein